MNLNQARPKPRPLFPFLARTRKQNLRAGIGWLVNHLVDVEFINAENVPPDGEGIILATNHMSRADIPILYMTPGRHDVMALVAHEYRRFPPFRWILETSESIWIDRDVADFSAMRAAIEVLRKRGFALGIAPEGTRSKSGMLLQGKPGVVLLAERARTPVVPVAIAGSENVFRALGHFRRAKVTVTYGKPFVLPPIARDDREDSLQELTDEIMCRIAAMLPEKYWGYYKDHLRLKELL